MRRVAHGSGASRVAPLLLVLVALAALSTAISSSPAAVAVLIVAMLGLVAALTRTVFADGARR